MSDQRRKWLEVCFYVSFFCNIGCCMCCHWLEDLRVDGSMMGGFCDPGGSGLSSLLRSCFCNDYKIKGCDKGTRAKAVQECFIATLEWLTAPPVEWSYVRSAASYLNRRVINQPAQWKTAQQLLPDQLWVLLICSSSLSSTCFSLTLSFM